MDVKSVYNFVPAPEEKDVFKPDWAVQVNHDIPFSDGESGEIELTITAKTPIFIRNGHTKGDKDIFDKIKSGDIRTPNREQQNAYDRYISFSNLNGKYFIPGTSIKGMIRNVLEIMSFSRMKQVGNDIFGFRNLKNDKFNAEITRNKLRTGWLEKIDSNWVITECAIGRISIRDIERNYNVRFNAESSANEKYELLRNIQLLNKFSKNKDLGLTIRGNFIKTGTLYDFNNSGNFEGHLVFFGSIGNKKYEYIYTEPNNNQYDISLDQKERFDAIDKDDTTQWQYLNSNKNPYPNRRIPVFFALDENEKVKHFGFSRLYKITNTKYLEELSPLRTYYNLQENYKLDLSETIFGTVEDTEKVHGKNRNRLSLKGRVYINHAFAQGEVKEGGEVKMVLGSPKASYFPFYLKDSKTYLENATLSGFKKYPLHSTLKDSALNDENSEIETIIKPLPEATVFTCKLRFHNLRKGEIGALLSAISFHGQDDLLDHNLGSAKPLGYGRVNISLRIGSSLKFSLEEYLLAFEQMMLAQKPNWLKSAALKELYAMSKDPLKDFLLKYPQLEYVTDSGQKENEFLKYKELLPYSTFNGGIFKSISGKQQENEKLAFELADKSIKENEQKRLDEIRKRIEIEAEQKKEANRNLEQQIKEEGYKFLENESNFASGRNKIKKFKLIIPIDESDKIIIKAFIERCIKVEGEKGWKSLKRDNWLDVSSWVGRETAQQWYSKLIK